MAQAARPIFTVDLEGHLDGIVPWWNRRDWEYEYDYNNAYWNKPTKFLIEVLKIHGVKGIFYISGMLAKRNPGIILQIREEGHLIGSHGYYHSHNERVDDYSDKKAREYLGPVHSYRSPFWDTTPMPWPPSGGFFFRFFPYWLVKRNILKSGVFWIHPHDLDEQHPKLDNLWLNWKRHVGLKGARAKLERLLKEVEFACP